MKIIEGVFQPQAESQLARMDFEARRQGIDEPISDYINDKIALFHSAEPNAGQHNFPYLRSHILKGIYCNWVKAEVIRIDPTDEQTISNAAARAVGQAREAYELGAGIVANLDGLASTTVTNLQSADLNLGEPMEVGAVGNYRVETRTCYKCKKKGHIAAKCRSNNENTESKRANNSNNNKPIVCHYCQKKGHKRPECRKLAKDKAEGNYKPSPNKSPSVKQLTVPVEETEENDDKEWPSGDIVQAIYDPRPKDFWRRVDQEGSACQ